MMKWLLVASTLALATASEAADHAQWALVVFGSSTHVATFVEETTLTRSRDTVTAWTNQVFDEAGGPQDLPQAH